MTIKWTKQTVNPYELQVTLKRALREVLTGEGTLPDSFLPNKTVKTYLQQIAVFGDEESTLDALVANLRDAVFNFANSTEAK